MARHLSIPAFLSSKRSRVISMATAGTLAVAGAASAVAMALPSGAAATGSAGAFMTTVNAHKSAASATHTDTLDAQFAAQLDRAHQSVEQTGHRAAAKAAAPHTVTKPAKAHVVSVTRSKAPSVPSGTPQQIAQQMLGQYGWSNSQFPYLQQLWEKESGWDLTAMNPSSGAYGIPQALPGAQMASAGPDWQTNPVTQIKWGLNYIHTRYGSPAGAWAHEVSSGWY